MPHALVLPVPSITYLRWAGEQMLRVCKLEPDRHLRARFNLSSSFLKEKTLVEEESLLAIFFNSKGEGGNKT